MSFWNYVFTVLSVTGCSMRICKLLALCFEMRFKIVVVHYTKHIQNFRIALYPASLFFSLSLFLFSPFSSPCTFMSLAKLVLSLFCTVHLFSFNFYFGLGSTLHVIMLCVHFLELHVLCATDRNKNRNKNKRIVCITMCLYNSTCACDKTLRSL